MKNPSNNFNSSQTNPLQPKPIQSNPLQWNTFTLPSAFGEESTTVTVKALNNDNYLEAERLVDLFKQHCGPEFPFSEIYDPFFWYSSDKEHVCEHYFTSIVAIENEKFIGHLALKHPSEDKEISTGEVELVLLAIHPRYQHRILALSKHLWSRITALASRQNWNSILHWNLVSDRLAQVVAARCFDAHEVALIPNRRSMSYDHLKDLPNPNNKKCILLSVTCLEMDCSSEKVIYPPWSHFEKIVELYSPLQFKRTFKPQLQTIESISINPRYEGATNSATFQTKIPFDEQQSSASKNGVSFFHQEQFGLSYVRITPSEIVSYRQTIDELIRLNELTIEHRRKMCIQISMEDPACPEFCHLLEQSGFRFCGIIPSNNQLDFVMFTEFENWELQEIPAHTSVLKSLKSYLISSTPGQSLNQDFRKTG